MRKAHEQMRHDLGYFLQEMPKAVKLDMQRKSPVSDRTRAIRVTDYDRTSPGLHADQSEIALGH